MLIRITLFLALLFSGFTAWAQSTVSGTITDNEGTVLIGASVLATGTTTGTVTDIDGNFTLSVPAGSEFLTISYTGFANQRVPLIAGQTVYDITLQENAETLEQVVVTGYGTSTRRQLTTSIASIDGDEAFNGVPVTSFENALQGRLPGVQITSNSGTLGAQTGIRVRGIGSINSDNQPLFVVDGIILESNVEGLAFGGPGTNPLVNLNPADIESIDVLKDAASAAIYGSRGSNGVVIITTKSGSFGQRAKVRLSHFTGITSPTAQYDLLSGPEYAEYWNQATRDNTIDDAEEN
ncbi:MAG: TonB-dependent receptor plug domain-containing protein, partial [Bacteroidota bacterium]